MENQENVHTTEPSDNNLNTVIANKLSYLQALQTAIQNQDDRKVYELLDQQRYDQEIRNNSEAQPTANAQLVADSHAELSHYLSEKLIDYLGHTYPFFYYDEFALGQFHIYFGNWWDRRLFGSLDVLNVAFNFDSDEFNKLQQTFELARSGKRLNSDKIDEISAESEQLQDLIDQQDERDAKKAALRSQMKENSQKSTMPWDSGKVKEERQQLIDQLSDLADEDERALNSNKTIKENDDRILALSKENTIMEYEKQSVEGTFGDFNKFQAHNQSLYVDYLNSLFGAGVKSND
ncbi:exonuclease SbcC [Levilactobacillus bambusae]|uniref:Exonuclease SbcC n=1 Tax=Levilactobacillus bambusae TaxID=2024736 RepID=A0A2V1N5P5_9LACO|nr:exonuclease SbcC [Levilactobacillus bambusae]PWG00940.1 exonuclease SbcC [Levilactobacillus bambusae]